MSENTYLAFPYHELKKLASQRGIDSTGNKEVLAQRLLEADEAHPHQATASPSVETEGASSPTAVPPTDMAQRYKSRALQMKAILDAQPRVRIFIPFDAGENPSLGAKIPQIVNIRGYQFTVPRGRYVEVPQQVADMIQERLESEQRAGVDHLIDNDPAKLEALS